MSISHSIPPTPTIAVPPTSTPAPTTSGTDTLLALVRGYGYAENLGVTRRQQRALTLLTQQHVTPLDLTLTADGCPIVIRFRVQSEAGEGHYYVTRTPNATTHTYACTCPDTWQPCKHAYASTLYQHALYLAHTYRTALPTYDGLLATLGEPLGSHELIALHVLLATATRYPATAQAAAQQYYGARQSYASRCFSRFIDQVRWCYGTGYVGISDNRKGELHNVAGTHVLHVHWHSEEVRWYIVGVDGHEDVARTRRILDAALPYWLQESAYHESDLPDPPPFEEEPDGHYLPIM